MTLAFRLTAAAALLAAAPHAFAQTTPAPGSTREDAVVRQAMDTYQAGLAAINHRGSPEAAGQPGVDTGLIRELALEEAVELALEKNLDIAVARLDPQAVDFTVAGVRNTYRPTLSTTFGTRDQVQLPTNQLNGGVRVSNGTSTFNFGLAQPVPFFGGSYTVNFLNSRLDTTNTFSNFNPSYTVTLNAAYVQPLLRGF